jgi:hypothetical protein
MFNDDEHAHAFGKPGIEPKWTRGQKDAIGAAYSPGNAHNQTRVGVRKSVIHRQPLFISMH